MEQPAIRLLRLGGYVSYDLSASPALAERLREAIPPDFLKGTWPPLSGYFMDHWARDLGPLWVSIINHLRYLARDGGPAPSPSQQELADAIGASYGQVVAALALYNADYDPAWPEGDRLRWIGAHAYLPLVTDGETHTRRGRKGGGKPKKAYHPLRHDAPHPLASPGLEWFIAGGQLQLRLAVPNPCVQGLGNPSVPGSPSPILDPNPCVQGLGAPQSLIPILATKDWPVSQAHEQAANPCAQGLAFPPHTPHESAAAKREAAAEGGTSARTTAEIEEPPLAHPLPDGDAAAEGTPLGELLSLGTPKRLALSWVNHPWSESGPVALACVQEYPRIAARKAAEGDPIESKWGYLRAIVAARLEARDPSPPVAHRRKAAAAANPAGSAAERRAFEKLPPGEQARLSIAELHRKDRNA